MNKRIKDAEQRSDQNKTQDKQQTTQIVSQRRKDAKTQRQNKDRREDKMEESFLSHLETFASLRPTKMAVAFLDNCGTMKREICYKLLQTLSDRLAIQLLESKLHKGDRVVLVFPPSLDFLVAFIACLKAGMISVPVFPPNPNRKDSLLMFSKIVDNSKAKVALTNKLYNHMKKLTTLKQAFMKIGRASSPWPDDLNWIVIDVDNLSSTPNKPSSNLLLNRTPLASDIAFLQYTSGSTSDPKGVMITHANLFDNLTKITQELQAGPDTVVVSWLPQYHDMGLIGSYLGTIFCGGSGYYMSPLTFLQRPMLWIEAVSRFRATHLQAPNFAFKLTARKFEPQIYKNTSELKLDLSSVRHIINAAEPVTEDSIESFLNTFKPFGLKQNVMFPTYGLAEHTVFVCSGGKQRLTVSKEALEIQGIVRVVEGDSPEITTRIIGCGFPSNQGVDVRIVDPENSIEKNEDQVGEIWIHSNSKAAGYYNMVDETQKDFFATMKNDQTVQYLRSGDLGFMHHGELFICGRIKDLIIIGGRNYYPQDIEATAEACSEQLRPGCSAAFTMDPISGDSEQVALIAELREVVEETACDSIVESIRAGISQDHSLALSVVVLLRPKSIPKTTSGKIARAWCRKAFVTKKLDAVYTKSFSAVVEQVNSDINDEEIISSTRVERQDIQSMSKPAIIKLLSNDISKITNIPASSIKKNASMVSFMDSISMSQFKGLMEAQYGTKLSDEYLFREDVTLSKLADVVRLGFAADDHQGEGTPSNVSAGGGGLGQALGCPPGVCCTIL